MIKGTVLTSLSLIRNPYLSFHHLDLFRLPSFSHLRVVIVGVFEPFALSQDLPCSRSVIRVWAEHETQQLSQVFIIKEHTSSFSTKAFPNGVLVHFEKFFIKLSVRVVSLFKEKPISLVLWAGSHEWRICGNL